MLRQGIGRGVPVGGRMPLSARESSVSSTLQSFTKSYSILVKRSFIAISPIGIDHEADPGLMLVEPSKKTGPRWAAPPRIIHLGAPDTPLRESVKVWGFDFTSKASHIGVSEIIRKDNHYVGL